MFDAQVADILTAEEPSEQAFSSLMGSVRYGVDSFTSRIKAAQNPTEAVAMITTMEDARDHLKGLRLSGKLPENQKKQADEAITKIQSLLSDPRISKIRDAWDNYIDIEPEIEAERQRYLPFQKQALSDLMGGRMMDFSQIPTEASNIMGQRPTVSGILGSMGDSVSVPQAGFVGPESPDQSWVGFGSNFKPVTQQPQSTEYQVLPSAIPRGIGIASALPMAARNAAISTYAALLSDLTKAFGSPPPPQPPP
jgi:hypothetical protein